MHSAPAVSYPVGRSAIRTACLVLPWLLAGLVCAAWVLQSDERSVGHALALALWLAGAGLIFWDLRHPRFGVLAWDGQGWTWEAQQGRQAGLLRSRLDWQQGLLLEFLPEHGAGFWLWLERREAPRAWPAMRCAVYARPLQAPTPVADTSARGEAGS